MRKSVVLAATLAMAFSAGAASADTILFDPDGAGPLGAVQIDLFDVAPGNVINRGVTGTSAPSTQGDVLFQANLSVAKLGDTIQYANNSSSGQDAHKFLAGLPVHVTTNSCLVAPVAPCTLTFDFGTDATNFFQIFAGTSPGVDRTGAGYPAPGDTLILEGTWLNDPDFFAAFTTNDLTPDEPLDQFGTNNYPGVTTIEGSGAFKGNVDVTFWNPAYFPTFAGGTIFVGSSEQRLPFQQANPSECFYDGTTACGYAGVANVAPLNGLSGPDTMLQSDASFSFLVPAQVPEPATMALFGLVLLGGGATLRRRHMRG